ncbi:MAG: tetratricopeptide repeat protein [Flavobacteriales bacterium]|nr:tetratricopeptide repeat protein [Flavobacteriales bacterium]
MRKPSQIILLALLPLFGQAQYLADNGRRASAVDVFAEAEKAYRAGDHATAIGHLNEVLGQDPDHLNAYLLRGWCKSALRDHAGAVSDLTAVIERKPDHLWAFISRGSAYNKLQRYDLALKDLDRAIEIDPKDPEAYNNRGWAHKGKGQLKAACADWQTSQRLGNAEAKIILKNTRCE